MEEAYLCRREAVGLLEDAGRVYPGYRIHLHPESLMHRLYN